MNQKELNEIRRRFKLDKNSISRIYGCYVNSSREIIAYIDESMGLMSQEEQEMYLGLLKKALSGGLGRNLINIEFSTAQVAGSDEHRLLQAVRQSSAQDKDAREALYRRIIDAMDWARPTISSCWLPTPTMCPIRAATTRCFPTAPTRCSSTFCAASAL